MKKFLYSVLALGAAATLASCSSEEPLGPNDRPNDGKVTFNLCLEGAQTRAFGETTDCNEIIYTVFDMNDQVVLEDKTETAFGTGVNTATVELQLVANQQYKVIFYAHNNNSNFSSYANGVVTVNYGSENIHVNSNVDDAFINKQTYTPAGATEALPNQVFTADGNAKTVYLTRPFAQVNFGTNDLNNTAVQNILDNVSTEFTVSSGLYSTYSVLDEEATTEYTGAYTATTGKPQENTDFPVGGYSNLLSAYLLVDQAQSVINANYTIKLAGKPNINTLNLSAMPVQGNYRTNVYGSLLTTQNDFNVTIVPTFDGTINQDMIVAKPGQTLSELVSNYTGNDAYIVLDPTTEYTTNGTTFKKGVKYTLDGKGTATLNIVGIPGNGVASVTLNNMKVKTTYDNFQGSFQSRELNYNNCEIEGTAFLYAKKVSYKKCTFTTKENGYAVWTYGCGDVTFDSCIFNAEYTAKGILVYGDTQGLVFNVTVNNCTFNCSEACNTSDKGAIEIHTERYTPFAGGNITINNCTASPKYEGGLWREWHNVGEEHATDYCKVTVNGEVVQQGK